MRDERKRVVPSETRERILESSRELFRRQGYMGTGVKQIVAEAGARSARSTASSRAEEELGARRSAFGPSLAFCSASTPGPTRARRRIRAFFEGAAETLRGTDPADACRSPPSRSRSRAPTRSCTGLHRRLRGLNCGGTERFVAEGIPRERSHELMIQ